LWHHTQSKPKSIKLVSCAAQKLLNSGYGIPQTRRRIVNGLKRYERKILESKKPGERPLHMSEARNREDRLRKPESKTHSEIDDVKPDRGSGGGARNAQWEEMLEDHALE
jgi:hypothetical protein